MPGRDDASGEINPTTRRCLRHVPIDRGSSKRRGGGDERKDRKKNAKATSTLTSEEEEEEEEEEYWIPTVAVKAAGSPGRGRGSGS